MNASPPNEYYQGVFVKKTDFYKEECTRKMYKEVRENLSIDLEIWKNTFNSVLKMITQNLLIFGKNLQKWYPTKCNHSPGEDGSNHFFSGDFS